jgi:hypothetical protein
MSRNYMSLKKKRGWSKKDKLLENRKGYWKSKKDKERIRKSKIWNYSYNSKKKKRFRRLNKQEKNKRRRKRRKRMIKKWNLSRPSKKRLINSFKGIKKRMRELLWEKKKNKQKICRLKKRKIRKKKKRKKRKKLKQ